MTIHPKKSKGKLLCVCREARPNCELLCPRGRKLNPDEVFNWPQWLRKKEEQGK